MKFNSLEFLLFLPLVFATYWLIRSRNIKIQNILIIGASYLFYGWWDWRFLTLIFFSTIVDYSLGLYLKKQQNQKKRKVLLWLSISTNLGLLLFFKYYNFFVDSFIDSFASIGIYLNSSSLDIILPVGISFYTFQTLSYTIDIYRNKINPTKDLIAFTAFVSFFPQLVAGPIERASHLLPQFLNRRKFDFLKASDGLKQILWGLFKKMVIADTCAVQASLAFDNPTDFTGSSLALGLVYFSVQIYCDFSGYSDIAIGTSRLFGFDLKKNFAFPFFSRDIGEFWRRWHISLSTWFRDYLYVPLGGNQGGTIKIIRNIFIIFIVSGFWHGAQWTFLIWGFLNALYMLPIVMAKSNSKQKNIVAHNSFLPSIKDLLKMSSTFALITFAWIFFKSESIEDAFVYLSQLISTSFFASPSKSLLSIFMLVPILFSIEWIGRRNEYAIEKFANKAPTLVRWTMYLTLIISIYLFAGEEQEFIYFQF